MNTPINGANWTLPMWCTSFCIAQTRESIISPNICCCCFRGRKRNLVEKISTPQVHDTWSVLWTYWLTNESVDTIESGTQPFIFISVRQIGASDQIWNIFNCFFTQRLSLPHSEAWSISFLCMRAIITAIRLRGWYSTQTHWLWWQLHGNTGLHAKHQFVLNVINYVAIWFSQSHWKIVISLINNSSRDYCEFAIETIEKKCAANVMHIEVNERVLSTMRTSSKRMLK